MLEVNIGHLLIEEKAKYFLVCAVLNKQCEAEIFDLLELYKTIGEFIKLLGYDNTLPDTKLFLELKGKSLDEIYEMIS